MKTRKPFNPKVFRRIPSSYLLFGILPLSACGGGGDGTSNGTGGIDGSAYVPPLTDFSHSVGGTTQVTGTSAAVLAPYENYPTTINGDFDFTHLQLDYSKLEFSSAKGPLYELTDGYTGMVYYGNFGDLNGDGQPEMVISGWTVNTGNASGRIFILELDPENGITNVEWIDNEGTAAPWVADFDNDGLAEILSVGFYDFPIAPAETVYFNGDLQQRSVIGPAIDSHESAVVDYDGDGDLDVVAISYNQVTGLISLYENTGSSFEHKYLPTDQTSYFATGSSIEYADLDGDGYGEFIVGDFAGDGGIAILRLNEDGTFLNNPTWRTILPNRPYFEDSRFDGINSKFTINNPDATPEQIAAARSHDVAFKVHDIDLDGDLDIINSTSIWSDTTPMGVYQILINQGDGTFVDETDERLLNFSLTSDSSHDPLLIDINNDGFVDLLSPETSGFGGNSGLAEGDWDDFARLTEGNQIYLNDGEGYFLQIAHAPFSRPGTFTENGAFYPNKWYPIIHADGSIGFVQLDHKWENYPNGEYDLFNYAHLNQTLYTGPGFLNPADYGAPGFNEFYVLRNNPDVQTLVKQGTFGSALEWYLETEPTGVDTFAKHAKVLGSNNDDIIVLREGDETAIGLGGSDTLIGNSGADTFVFNSGEELTGSDTIQDFTLTDGDKLDLSSYGIETEEQAEAILVDAATGASVVIDGNTVVTMTGVSVDDLTAANGWIA